MVLLGHFATASSPNWPGQYFCAFPAACSILTLKLVVKAMKTWPIQDGRRLTEHSKNYDSAGDWLWSQSQHLISLFLCFLGVGGRGLLSMGRQSIRKTCPLSGHQLLQKSRTFGLGPAPLNKHKGFQYTVPSDIKVARLLIRGEGGRRQKARLASWNMQLLWLDSVPAGSQSLHKNYPTMFTWERTTCGACPTVKLVEQVWSRLEGQGLQGTLSAVAICMKRIL